MEYELRPLDTEIDGGEWPQERKVVKGWLRSEQVTSQVGGSDLVSRGWLALCDDDVAVFPRYVVRNGEQVAKLRDPAASRHIAIGDGVCMVYDAGSKILLTYSIHSKPSAVLLSSLEGAVVGMGILGSSLHIATASGSQASFALTLSVLPIIEGLPVISSKATERVTLKGSPPKVLFSTHQDNDRCVVLFGKPRIARANATGSAIAVVSKAVLTVTTVSSGVPGDREPGTFIQSPYYPGNVGVHLVPLGFRTDATGVTDVSWVKRPCSGWYLVVASSTFVSLVDPWASGAVFKHNLQSGVFALLPKRHQVEERGIRLGLVDTADEAMHVSLHAIGARDYKLAINDALEAEDIEKAKGVAAQSGLSSDVVWEVGWENSAKRVADVKKYFPSLSAGFITQQCKAPLTDIAARWHMLRHLATVAPRPATYLTLCLAGCVLLSTGCKHQKAHPLGTDSSIKRGWWQRLVNEPEGFARLIAELVARRMLDEASVLLRLTCDHHTAPCESFSHDLLRYMPPSTPFEVATAVLPGIGLSSLLHVGLGEDLCFAFSEIDHSFDEDISLDTMSFMVHKVSSAGLTQNALQWANAGWDEGMKFAMSDISVIMQSPCRHARTLAFGSEPPSLKVYEGLPPLQKLLCLVAAGADDETTTLRCSAANFTTSKLDVLRKFCSVVVAGESTLGATPIGEAGLKTVLSTAVRKQLFLSKEQKGTRFGKVWAKTFDVQKRVLEDAGMRDTSAMASLLWENFVVDVLQQLPEYVAVPCTPALLLEALVRNKQLQPARAYAGDLLESAKGSEVVDGLTKAAADAMHEAASLADGEQLSVVQASIDLWDELVETGHLDHGSCEGLAAIREQMDTYSEIAGRFPASAPFVAPSETGKLVDAVLSYNEVSPDDISSLVSACRRLGLPRAAVLSKVIHHAVSRRQYDLAVTACTMVAQSTDVTADDANILLREVLDQFGSALSWEDWSYLTAKITATTAGGNILGVLQQYPHRCSAYPVREKESAIIDEALAVIDKGGAAKQELLLKTAMVTLVDTEAQRRTQLEQGEALGRWIIKEEVLESTERALLCVDYTRSVSTVEEALHRLKVLRSCEEASVHIAALALLSMCACDEAAVRCAVMAEADAAALGLEDLFVHEMFDTFGDSMRGVEQGEEDARHGLCCEWELASRSLELEIECMWLRLAVSAEEEEASCRFLLAHDEHVFRTTAVPLYVEEESERQLIVGTQNSSLLELLPEFEAAHRKFLNAGVKLGYKAANLEKAAGSSKHEAYVTWGKRYDKIIAQFKATRQQIVLRAVEGDESVSRASLMDCVMLECSHLASYTSVYNEEWSRRALLVTRLQLLVVEDNEEELRYGLALEEDRDHSRLTILQEDAVEKDLRRIERLGLFIMEEEEERGDVESAMLSSYNAVCTLSASSLKEVQDIELERKRFQSELALSIRKTPTSECQGRLELSRKEASEWKVLESDVERAKFLLLASVACDTRPEEEDPATSLLAAGRRLLEANRCEDLLAKDRSLWEATFPSGDFAFAKLSFSVAYAAHAAASEVPDPVAGQAFSAAVAWVSAEVLEIPQPYTPELQLQVINRYLGLFLGRLKQLRDDHETRGARFPHLTNAIRCVEGCTVVE